MAYGGPRWRNQPRRSGQPREKDQWGIEQDETGLRDKSVFKGDEEGTDESRSCSAVEYTECKVGEGGRGQAQEWRGTIRIVTYGT